MAMKKRSAKRGRKAKKTVRVGTKKVVVRRRRRRSKKTVRRTTKRGKKKAKRVKKKVLAKPATAKRAKKSRSSAVAKATQKTPAVRPSVITLTARKISISSPASPTAGGMKHIKDYLASRNVRFETIRHSPTYTAQQSAASVHISGKDFAKPVIVKIDGKLAMVVEPAHLKIDLDALKRHLNAQRIELATEAEFKNRFPNCEVGAIPPFGNLYGMDVYISESLTKEEKIAFNAGTHSELIKMSYKDFHNLVRPRVITA